MSKNSSNSSSEICEGNSKQISPAKHWCFTLHNYSEDDISNILKSSSNSSNFCIFAKETGKSGETHHLQGFISFKEKVRPISVINIEHLRWFKTKGNKQQNIDYIKKEFGDYYLNGILHKKLKLIEVLYPWQEALKKKLIEEEDDRRIDWYWCKKGCTGKSAFAKYMCAKHNALILSGKTADMKYGIIKYTEKNHHPPGIIIIDCPRYNIDYINYGGIEEIKNGCFFSNKYESDMFLMNSPNIIIFANQPPDTSMMSLDRWCVRKL